MDRRIGLIAGGGSFPVIFARKARAKGFSVFAVAYVNEAEKGLKEYTEEILWIHLGQVKKLINFFRQNRIDRVVMMGSVKKTRMFRDVRPDFLSIRLMAKMRNTHDDGLLRGFADFLEQSGIRVAPATFLLPELIAEKGCWTKRRPDSSEMADIRLGWKVAKEIGRLDIGQSVVVGGGSVLAVEAIDGTDATIRRGGSLADGCAVAVKVIKPHQDTRFDMPAVGLETIRSMKDAGVGVLAVEAGKTVVIEKESMVRLADELRISIVALDESLRL